ncbi:MAG: hypothetical protein J6Y20_06295 [Lachnospiraceae bacterium]|nr:hypothetical protein [Lachnospiraceae bacterium]
MDYLEKQPFPASENTVSGSLLEDLRYLKGNCDGLEWLIIYEHRELLTMNQDTMLYAKMVILSEKGRHTAEFGRQEIFNKCNFLKGDEVRLFLRAIVLAINKWDDAHPRKPAPHPEFDNAEEL